MREAGITLVHKKQAAVPETASAVSYYAHAELQQAGTCFLRGKTPDDPNSPRLLIDTADPSQTHLVDWASIIEYQPAATPRRSVSQADVPAQEGGTSRVVEPLLPCSGHHMHRGSGGEAKLAGEQWRHEGQRHPGR
ncbi:hypothetical protein HPB47_016823 [Ixodes persulcatus]|uniref:Uncharacterized protein n=1 Tax=Ixodes persulcatus TaxID=34615 RepID=A0AC60QPX1_IXOPE|nr:hypothetical protein HPB47_016823 [Ixodes persulcatus]